MESISPQHRELCMFSVVGGKMAIGTLVLFLFPVTSRTFFEFICLFEISCLSI